ncbi:VanZ family protein [Rubrolithibacter danxiaensis]|uniref:VanZ family protein n=1 Tax=Rubrolithibacter danxiaensis TaxID=3390805 RepID=UPI003BF8B550
MFRTIRYQYPAILWSIMVLVLCNLPPSSFNKVPAFPGIDKLVHTGFFFVLTVFLFFGKIRQQHSFSYRILTIVKIILLTGFLGGGIELLQLEVFTYRSADWWDFFADMTGVGMGVFSYILLHRSNYDEKSV